MPAILEIRENFSGLTMHVHENRRYPHIVLSLLAGAIAMYLFLRAGSGSRLATVFVGALVAVAVLGNAISLFRGTDVTLDVGNLDFRSSGHAPAGYRPSITSRADIYNLVFRKASGGTILLNIRKDSTPNTELLVFGIPALAFCPISMRLRQIKPSKQYFAAFRTREPLRATKVRSHLISFH